MPQMMPMYWFYIFLSTLIFLLIIINQLYFFNLPKINIKKMSSNINLIWIWKW